MPLIDVTPVVKKKKRGGISDKPLKPTKTGFRALECLLCRRRYSREDVLNGLYQIPTLVCSYCYAEMQRKPYNESCFGKPSQILLSGKKLLGYDSKAYDCAIACPDREICALIVRPTSIVSEEREHGTDD